MNGLTMAFVRWCGFRSNWGKMPDKPILIKRLTYTEPEAWRQVFECALRASMMRVRTPLFSSEDAQDIAQSAVLLLFRKVSESGLPASIQSDEQLRRYVVAVVRELSSHDSVQSLGTKDSTSAARSRPSLRNKRARPPRLRD